MGLLCLKPRAAPSKAHTPETAAQRRRLLIDDRWLEIGNRTVGDVLACTSRGEERAEGIDATVTRLVTWHLVNGRNTQFK